MVSCRHHLTLIDLMAVVGAAALAFGWIVSTAPGQAAPGCALIVIGPVVGILWDRWRGRKGMLGGALGGAAYAGLLLIWVLVRQVPSAIASGPVAAVFSIAACSIFGALMGIAAWLVAAMMGRSVAPTSPSSNDQIARPR